MSSLLANEYIVIPIVGVCIFLLAFMWSDRVLNWLHNRSLGQRAEVISLLRSMFVEVDENRITLIMLVSSFGSGFLFFLICWPNYGVGFAIGAIVTVAGWSVPKLVVSSMHENRAKQIVNQMVDGLTIMANGIRAGKSVQQTIERVVENTSGPLSKEMEVVLSDMRLGSSLEEALTKFGERVPKPDVQMFVTSINVLKETGGNLSETFDTIVTVIRERQKIEKKIEAMTAQGVTQGMIITAVPAIILGVMYFLDPNSIKMMFTTVVGIIALAMVVGLQIMGGLMIKKIVTIKV